jgi:hypothetical protein
VVEFSFCSITFDDPFEAGIESVNGVNGCPVTPFALLHPFDVPPLPFRLPFKVKLLPDNE